MYAASAVGSAAGSVYSRRFKLGGNPLANALRGGDDLDASRRPSLENAIFGVLFTLSKENSEVRIVIRWALLKILLDGWQIFTTVIQPSQGWDINENGTAWTIVSILSFGWLADLGYGAYVALLYGMVTLLALNIGLCIWVAWCFKEQKFPVVWPIKVLRLFTSVFFQAFDVASLNLLQLGFSCHFTGPSEKRLYFALFPQYSCAAMPQVVHAVVSGVSLLVFVALALLTNMSEVEVNPKSRRPMALGHSGPEVMAFALKVLMTLTDVFLGWVKVSSCVYLVLSLLMAWQYIRWSPNLVNWVNHLKCAVSVAIVWCSAVLIFLVFRPGVKEEDVKTYNHWMTVAMLAGIAPAGCVGVLISWLRLRWAAASALKAIGLAAAKGCPLQDITIDMWSDPRDVEIAARCCRVWVDRNMLDKEAVARSQVFIKAGLACFPGNAFVSLVQANFMIDVLGVGQSGSRQIEAARKLNPGIMSRFIIFVRMQQAQQKAAGTSAGAAVEHNMDLLGYVEYQRKQRMVVRLHREALTAMCSFWKALDSHTVSFTYLSKALANIEVSVGRAQSAYHLVLETYGNNFRLVRLYGKFLETVKNDPWGALEYYTEADRLEQEKNDDGNGPLLPDGTPLSRMDELATAVVVVSSTGEIQMANKQVHHLFGFKKGDLDGKPMTMLLAPQSNKRITNCLSGLVERSMAGLGQTTEGQGDHTASTTTAVLAMHHERMAFPLRISITKASGVGEDSTFIALLEPVHVSKDVSYFWVAGNGVIAGIDPQFVANFGYMPHDVIGAHLGDFLSVEGELLASRGAMSSQQVAALTGIDRWDVEAASIDMSQPVGESVNILHSILETSEADNEAPCRVTHRYTPPVACVAFARKLDLGDAAFYEIKICRANLEPYLMMVTDRKGAVKYASPQLTNLLCPRGTNAPGGQLTDGDAFKDRADSGHKGVAHHGLAILSGVGAAHGLISGYTLQDFLPHPWKYLHNKLLKDAASGTSSSRNIWGCTRQAGRGPSLELHDAHSQRLFLHVAVGSTEIMGEHLHVIRMAHSNQEAAVSERRLRVSVSSDGIITGVSKDTPCQQLFGFDSSVLVGQALWEVLDGVEQQLLMRPGSSLGRVNGPRQGNATAFSAMLEKVIRSPGRSWRVSVLPPPPSSGSGSGGTRKNAELAAAQRAAQVRPAIMEVHIPILEKAEEDEGPGSNDGEPAGVLAAGGVGNTSGSRLTSVDGGGKAMEEPDDTAVLVDLWPISSVSAVVELNALGRIIKVCEEHVRPAGLLFGLPTKLLVGQSLTALVPLPAGREEIGDLLSANNKKSSLKQSQKDPNVKVGPVHVLDALHSDGHPLKVALQVIGKPGYGQPLTVLMRLHGSPLAPASEGRLAPDEALQLEPAESATPSLGEMEDIVEGRSVAPRSERPTATGMSVGNRSFNKAQASTEPHPPAGPSLRARASFHIPTSPTSPTSPPAALEKSGTGKFSAGAGAAGAAADGASGGGGGRRGGSPAAGAARPAAPSTPRKTPAELVGPLEDGSGSGQSPMPGTPPVPIVPVGATGGPPPMPAALARLAMDLPLPGVVTGSASGHGGIQSARRTSLTAMAAAPPAAPTALKLPEPTTLKLPEPAPADKSPKATAKAPPRPLKKAVKGPDEELSDSDIEGSAGVKVDESSKEDSSKETSEAGGNGNDDDVKTLNPKSMARIFEWVETKGEVYQNSKPSKSPFEERTTVEDLEETRSSFTADEPKARTLGGGGATSFFGVRSRAPVGVSSRAGSAGQLGALDGQGARPGSYAGGAALPQGLAPPVNQNVNDLDDAASAGGQSAMSGGSGASSGAEYKRGKRFRNLVKLMDSSEAEQVLRRFRRGALLTMAILAVAHTICFALVVVSIKGQHNAMSHLFIAGRSQRMLHQALVSVRALDQIYKNKKNPLYDQSDNQTFAENALTYASDVKDLYNYVAKENMKEESIRDLYYFSTVKAWVGVNSTTGEDVYNNIALWDMATKVYTSSKDVYQNHLNGVFNTTNISSTPSGQFLLKSGPELFNGFRKVLDALLYIAMDNTTNVNNLLLAFLVAEGCGVSVLAAALLAYLLRKLAVQRYTLYGTFLAIPVGLTRALTSQLANTTLLEEEDDDDEEDDEHEDGDGGKSGGSGHHNHHSEGGDGSMKQRHRHATLELAPAQPSRPRPSFQDAVIVVATAAGGGPSKAVGGGVQGAITSDPSSRQGIGAQQPALMSPTHMRWRSSSWKSLAVYSLIKCFPCLARRSHAVFPSPGPSAGDTGHHHKRTLRLDSNDTTRLLMPFVLWSCLVVTFYAVSVAELKQSSPLVAIASVCNFNAARTYRSCFFAQELAAEEDATKLQARRATLKKATIMLRDAFYTLQLGDAAWKTLGNDTERFPLVSHGLSYETRSLQRLFYANKACLRREPNLPCPGPEYRWYQLTHAGVDSIMQTYLSHLFAMAEEVTDVQPGLANPHLDFIYNVGTKDLTDANIQIGELHYEHVRDLFDSILLLHILLFVLLWFFLAGFYGLLLKPLLARLAREKRHIAELMSQLPLELDVEKLVRAALAATGGGGAHGSGHHGGEAGQLPSGAAAPGGQQQVATDAARVWKNVLRSTSNAIKDANLARSVTRDRRASMMSVNSMAYG